MIKLKLTNLSSKLLISCHNNMFYCLLNESTKTSLVTDFLQLQTDGVMVQDHTISSGPSLVEYATTKKNPKETMFADPSSWY